jgi:hypothetical protein
MNFTRMGELLVLLLFPGEEFNGKCWSFESKSPCLLFFKELGIWSAVDTDKKMFELTVDVERLRP